MVVLILCLACAQAWLRKLARAGVDVTALTAAQGRQIETKAAPLRYWSRSFGVADQETAIQWLIALMVMSGKISKMMK